MSMRQVFHYPYTVMMYERSRFQAWHIKAMMKMMSNQKMKI